jgi:hypothetical protein
MPFVFQHIARISKHTVQHSSVFSHVALQGHMLATAASACNAFLLKPSAVVPQCKAMVISLV